MFSSANYQAIASKYMKIDDSLYVETLRANNIITDTVTSDDVVINSSLIVGNISIENSSITGLSLPTENSQAVNKEYVVKYENRLFWKDPVKVATTAAITLSGLQTIDDIPITDGQRVLVKNQLLDTENGIYISSSEAWARSGDASTETEALGAIVPVISGLNNQGTSWYVSSGSFFGTSVQFSRLFGGPSAPSGPNNSIQINKSGILFGTSNLVFTSSDGLSMTGDLYIKNIKALDSEVPVSIYPTSESLTIGGSVVSIPGSLTLEGIVYCEGDLIANGNINTQNLTVQGDAVVGSLATIYAMTASGNFYTNNIYLNSYTDVFLNSDSIVFGSSSTSVTIYGIDTVDPFFPTSAALRVGGSLSIGKEFTTGGNKFTMHNLSITTTGTETTIFSDINRLYIQSQDDISMNTTLDMNFNAIKNVGTPTEQTDAANKIYVDNKNWKNYVNCVDTTEMTPFELVIGAIVDGYTLGYGDKVLSMKIVGNDHFVKGIYQVVGIYYEDAIPSYDATIGSPATGTSLIVLYGNTYEGTSWRCVTDNAVYTYLNYDLLFEEFAKDISFNGSNKQIIYNATGSPDGISTVTYDVDTDTFTSNSRSVNFGYLSPQQQAEKSLETWFTRSTGIGSFDFLTIEWNNSIFLALSSVGILTRSYRSFDNILWSSSTIPNSYWVSLKWSEQLGLFVAVANVEVIDNLPYCMKSENGINWCTISIAANHYNCITWSPELYIFAAVGSEGVIISNDTVSWSTGVIATDSWKTVTWGLGKLICLSNDKGAYSYDGIIWSTFTLPLAGQWSSVIWSQKLERFCAVGTLGFTMYSYDGLDWKTSSPSETNEWVSIVWSEELSIFVGLAVNGNNRLISSTDGINWTTFFLNYRLDGYPHYKTMVWCPQESVFVVAGNTTPDLTDAISVSDNNYGIGSEINFGTLDLTTVNITGRVYVNDKVVKGGDISLRIIPSIPVSYSKFYYRAMNGVCNIYFTFTYNGTGNNITLSALPLQPVFNISSTYIPCSATSNNGTLVYTTSYANATSFLLSFSGTSGSTTVSGSFTYLY